MTSRVAALALAALVLLSAAGAGVGPAAAAGTNTDIFAESVTENTGLLGGWSASEDVVRYGAEANPGWVIEYDDGHAADLEAWADGSESRTIRSANRDSNIMVISAPPEAIGFSYFSLGADSLRELSYVEKIGVNRRVSIDPITRNNLRDTDAWEKPSGAFMATYGGIAGSFDADGAAWSTEVNASSLQDVREDVEADRVNVDGSGQRVAVLDTGLRYNESLYGDRVVGAYNAITNETVTINNSSNVTATDLEPVYDGSDSRHGSWVTTAIAGNGSGPNATGVAPGAEIVSVKTLGDDGSGSTDAIARGIEYAAQDANADVISMSLGSAIPSTEITAEISDALENKGVSAVVVAAGNNRMTYRFVASPGDSEEPIVTVAATDGKPINESESAYFSAVGPDPQTDQGPDVAAPGMLITAATGDGETTLSGTSMATPVVSGVALLTLEANPSLSGSPLELADRLETSAEPMQEAGITEVGDGRINAYNAVNGVSPEATQEATRNAEAESRDTGNEALSGSLWRRLAGE